MFNATSTTLYVILNEILFVIYCCNQYQCIMQPGSNSLNSQRGETIALFCPTKDNNIMFCLSRVKLDCILCFWFV